MKFTLLVAVRKKTDKRHCEADWVMRALPTGYGIEKGPMIRRSPPCPRDRTEAGRLMVEQGLTRQEPSHRMAALQGILEGTVRVCVKIAPSKVAGEPGPHPSSRPATRGKRRPTANRILLPQGRHDHGRNLGVLDLDGRENNDFIVPVVQMVQGFENVVTPVEALAPMVSSGGFSPAGMFLPAKEAVTGKGGVSLWELQP